MSECPDETDKQPFEAFTNLQSQLDQSLKEEHGDFIIAIKDVIEGNDFWAKGKITVEPQKHYGFAKDEKGEYTIPNIHDSFVIEWI